jgi:hypothetical protein
VWLGRSVLATGAIGAAVAAAFADLDLSALQPGLDELRTLHSTLTTELAAFQAGRAELEEQRVWLQLQSAELSARLSDFDRRAAALEAESSGIREQTARLEAALARVDAERQILLAAAESDQDSELEVASIEERERGLEEQREQFAAKQTEVSSELDLLSRRRNELEERRIALEAQRRELEALLNDAGRGASSAAPVMAESADGQPSGAFVPTSASPSQDEAAGSEDDPFVMPDFSVASTISPDTLGNIRGGIRLGDGMDVSIGLTRSATVNGIEQVTNTLTLDGLNRSIGSMATEGFAPVIIQSGPGNVIDSSFLDGIPGFSGTIIQNTLDDQVIDTTTIFDVSITDVSSAMDGMAAGQALRDSLYFQQ